MFWLSRFRGGLGAADVSAQWETGQGDLSQQAGNLICRSVVAMTLQRSVRIANSEGAVNVISSRNGRGPYTATPAHGTVQQQCSNYKKGLEGITEPERLIGRPFGASA